MMTDCQINEVKFFRLSSLHVTNGRRCGGGSTYLLGCVCAYVGEEIWQWREGQMRFELMYYRHGEERMGLGSI